MKAVNLRTEYLLNPIGIDIRRPRIRWNLEGGQRQSAYEVSYAVNGGAKKTVRHDTSEMFYDFEESFASRDIVTFSVTPFDESGNAGIAGEGRFEMGLFEPSDWKASWISGNYAPSKKKRYPVDCFRKAFTLQSIRKARLYLSACGLYESYLNGKRVGDFVLAPGSTDYLKRIQYQTYDVTDLLKVGDNVLEVCLADGWYRGSIGAKGRTNTFGKQTKFIAQLEVEDEAGKRSCLCSDSSFAWSNDGPIRFADLKDGEIVDGNKAPSYSEKAKAVRFNANLTASNNTFVQEQERFHPVSMVVTPSGKHLLEFKQNLAGYLSFRVQAHKGDVVKVTLGEMLDEQGELTLKNVQCVLKGKLTPLQQIVLICKEGVNEYQPHFFIAGFKYASIEFSGEIDPEDFTQIALYSSLEETSTFECSNPLINTFYRNTLWSLKSNSADIPTDCPTRERMGWTGDSQVFFNTASFLTDYAAFTRKHLVDVFDRQWKNGKLPQIAPFSNEDWFMATMNGSVGWADVGVLTPYRYYSRYDDLRVLSDNYDRMFAYAKFMMSRCGRAKGIYAIYARPLRLSKQNRRYQVNTGQSYGEWAEPKDVKAFSWKDFAMPHPEESMAYTAFIMDKMIEISRLVGKEENVALLTRYRDGVTKAYQELVSKKENSLDTNRQAKLVRPLFMGLLTQEQEEFARTRLIKALEAYGWRLGTGFLSTPFILDVLTQIDPEYAYRLLENEEMPGWLYMAKHDTGTIWEGWEGPNSESGIASLNHYSKGAMVEWLFSGMLGIHIHERGKIEIAPVVGGHVDHASGTYRSVYGSVASSWKREGNLIHFEIEVPVNVEATFRFAGVNKTLAPGHHAFELKESRHE